ncbi:MAG: chemotaxis protein CheC [Proteobacteria bacterium]|nr:chemotaxis protein CheC [Pseudomonadota bacterium]
MTDIEIEHLKEFFNIGAGGAANALGKIINKKVLIEVPKVSIVSPDKLVEQLGIADKLVTAVHFDIKGGFKAGILIIFDHQAVLNLASLTLKGFDKDIRSEKTISFIKEISNIMSSYFLNNFSKFIGKALIPSVPSYAMDMLGAVLEDLMVNYNKEGADIFFLETIIFNQEEKISFDFLLIPENGSFKKIF